MVTLYGSVVWYKCKAYALFIYLSLTFAVLLYDGSAVWTNCMSFVIKFLSSINLPRRILSFLHLLQFCFWVLYILEANRKSFIKRLCNYGLCIPIIYLSITTPEESKVFLFIKFLFLDTLYIRSHKKTFKWSCNCAMKYHDTKALYNST
jgi:hypothetical protein